MRGRQAGADEPRAQGREEHVAGATRQVADPRARHFWDGDDVLGPAVRARLGIPRVAWDVYLVYGPGDGKVPQGPFLDPVAFEAEVRRVEADAPRRLPQPEAGESPTGRGPGPGPGP